MLKTLKGTKDILPEEVYMWQYIEASARDIFAIYGYKEIRTPIIEDASLFIRSIGDSTDIVQKEMYVFSDRGGRTIALRPEATASVVRAYIENSIGCKEGLSKLFYIGPMFRSERPQKGRQRQFHQLGVEAIGSDDPFLDVEVILLAWYFLKRLGIDNFDLKINSLGCEKDKSEIIERYRKNVKPHLASLCKECNERYGKNVLRVLDCKNPKCKEVIRGIEFRNSLCRECSAHFEFIKEALERLGVSYAVDTRIVRGLDYYTKTVFEIIQKDLGAKDAVCAGGRYNNLIKDMGGKETPAIGFAFGIERLILAAKDLCSGVFKKKVFIATTAPALRKHAFKLVEDLRREKIASDMDYEGKSLKAQMKKAEKLKSSFVIIFGDEEFSQGNVVLKHMDNGTQRQIKIIEAVEEIKNR